MDKILRHVVLQARNSVEEQNKYCSPPDDDTAFFFRTVLVRSSRNSQSYTRDLYNENIFFVHSYVGSVYFRLNLLVLLAYSK